MGPRPDTQPDAQAPAGGVSAAVTDVATWVRLQLNGGTLDGEEIVSEEALQPTHTPHIAVGSPGTYDGQPISYGLGWNVSPTTSATCAGRTPGPSREVRRPTPRCYRPQGSV